MNVPEDACRAVTRWRRGRHMPLRGRLIRRWPLASAREVLGWRGAVSPQVLRRAVAWHLRHPPDDADTDFHADDRALAVAR